MISRQALWIFQAAQQRRGTRTAASPSPGGRMSPRSASGATGAPHIELAIPGGGPAADGELPPAVIRR